MPWIFHNISQCPFVHNSVCNFLESLFAIVVEFAILFEVLLMQIQEEIHHFAAWEGGVEGHQNCEQNFCEETGVSSYRVHAKGGRVLPKDVFLPSKRLL